VQFIALLSGKGCICHAELAEADVRSLAVIGQA